MGVLIKIEGANFNDKYIIEKVEIPDVPDEPVIPVEIEDYPVQDTLAGLYALGGTEEDTLVNHAPDPKNEQDESLQGSYEVADGYVNFKGSKAGTNRMLTYIRSKLSSTVTLVALFSVPDGGSYGNRVIMGNRGGGTDASAVGVSMLNDCVRFATNGAITEKDYPTPILSDNFAILALTIDPNGCRVVRYTNGSLTTLVDYEGAINAWGTNAIQIGGDSSSNAYDPAKISLAAIHEGAVTDEQLTEICAFVKQYGEQKGLTIE